MISEHSSTDVCQFVGLSCILYLSAVMKATIFTQERTVQSWEIDQMDHVNNVVYLQWVQDIAVAHWQHSATPEHQRHYQWVVLSHYIEYRKPAFLHDVVTLKTHVGTTEGARSTRFVEIYRADQLLAKAETIWCLLEATTQRPRRVPDEVMAPFFETKQI